MNPEMCNSQHREKENISMTVFAKSNMTMIQRDKKIVLSMIAKALGVRFCNPIPSRIQHY